MTPVHRLQRRFERTGDDELVEIARRGDTDAYAVLYSRHAAAARTVALSVTSSLDPDDLVSESFARVLQALRAGKGPTGGGFRPYLFTTVRNVAATWGKSGADTLALDPDDLDEFAPNGDDMLAAVDRSLTLQAFRSLPERWQEALWYSEVEGMAPARFAPMLGLSAQATSALCYRAREGLREAWIRAHLTSATLEPDCAWTVERLAARQRGRLGKRDAAKVQAHLDHCAKCTIVAEEAREVGDRIAVILLPAAIGAGAATAYLATLHGTAVGVAALGGGTVAAAGQGAAAAPGAAGGAGGASAATTVAGGGFFGSALGVSLGVAAAVVLVTGGAVAGVALAGLGHDAGTLDTASRHSADTGPSSAPVAAAPDASSATAPTTSPSPSATSVPSAPSSSASAASTGTGGSSATSSSGSSTGSSGRPTPSSSATPSPGATSTPTSTPTPTPTPSSTPTPTPTPTPTVPLTVTVTEYLLGDPASGVIEIDVTGTPGATVSIAIDGETVASGITLDGDGSAQRDELALAMSSGTHTVTVTSSTGQTATATFTG